MHSYVKPVSGGLDSATALYWAVDQGYEVTSFTLDYGQGSREQSIRAAKEIAEGAGVTHSVVPFQDLGGLVELDSAYGHIISDSYCVQATSADRFFVQALAAVNGFSVGCDGVITAVHADDGYDREYFDKIEEIVKLGTGKEWEIKSPFLSLSKSDVIKLGDELGVPLDRTWSCEFPQGNGERCGTCYLCTSRKRGFEEAGIEDPAEYVTDEMLTPDQALRRDKERYRSQGERSPALNAI